MAIPSQRKYDDIHAQNVERYSRQIKAAYRNIIDEISRFTYSLSLNPNNEFYFRNNPEVSNLVNEFLRNLYNDIYGLTIEGINTEWGLAVDKNNELATYVFGDKLQELPEEYRLKYFTSNDRARAAFISRKENGLRLSDRIWNNTRRLKFELELALDVGISEGRSAQNLAREIKSYLNEPDKLFRRVRDEKETLRLSKAARAYNPGQGTYRSSYRNALRLTRNETNFSYEASNFEKRKQQDFVVGMEIRTIRGYTRAVDRGGIVCGDLEGKYPKDFDWTYKWHVNCRCLSINILKKREELDNDIDRILQGNEPTTQSVNAVKSKPNNYTSYLQENSSKWENWKNKPRTFENN